MRMMKREIFNKKKVTGLDTICIANKTIVVFFEEDGYADLVKSNHAYKEHLKAVIDKYPELFPDTIAQGWSLNGFTKDSVKQGIRIRRIITKADNQVWQIRPSFVMPYMTCDTKTAEKILFLQKWAPSWALAHVFEKDVMTIHRLINHMGRYNMVGTTVKAPKHNISGEKVYIATTVAEQCYLGASVSPGAGEKELTEAYKQFKKEVLQAQPDYQPETVNTDGWQATMNAWKTLFPSICLIHKRAISSYC